MKNKIKLLLSRILYSKLGLEKYEAELINSNIEQKDIVNDPDASLSSKYFFLLNEINFDKLSADEYEYLSNSILNLENLDNNKLNELYEFLNNKMYDLLLPKTDLKYLYWGGSDINYMAPSDSIVFGLHYKLDMNDDQTLIYSKQEIVTDIANSIQNDAFKTQNMKVSVILYDNMKLMNARQL